MIILVGLTLFWCVVAVLLFDRGQEIAGLFALGMAVANAFVAWLEGR